MSMARNWVDPGSLTRSPRLAARAIWLIFLPSLPNSVSILSSISHSAFGSGARDLRWERVRTDT